MYRESSVDGCVYATVRQVEVSYHYLLDQSVFQSNLNFKLSLFMIFMYTKH